MLLLEVSIVVAFVLTSIVTMVTSISNTSQASSFLSLLLFNRSMALKVNNFEEISLLTFELWYADLFALIGLVI